MTSTVKNRKLAALTIFSFLFVFIFLSRPLVTPMGLESFGRLWQYFVSYEGLGFSRRTLLGTLLSITKINEIFSNAYHFAYLFYSLNILSLYILIYRKMRERDISLRLGALILFSPAMFFHFSYSSGNMDLFMLTYAVIIVGYIRSIYIKAMLIVVGPVFHESFLFLVPFIIFILWSNGELSRKWLFSIIGSLVVVMAVLNLFGQIDLSHENYVAYLRSKPAGLLYRDGYFEVASSTSDHAALALETLNSLKTNWYYFILPVAYLLLIWTISWNALVGINDKGVTNGNGSLFFFYPAILIAPLLISFVGQDFLRWLCMSIQVGFISILYAKHSSEGKIPISLINIGLIFSFLGPIGSAAFSRAFPAWNFFFEKLLN